MDKAKKERIEARNAKIRAQKKNDDVEFVPETDEATPDDLPTIDS